MKNGHLYIFTHAYPYGYGEPFLKAELPYLKKEFRKVTVIPTHTEKHKREIAAGVDIDTRFSKILLKNPLSRFLSGLGQIFSENHWDETKNLIKKQETTRYAWYKLMNTIYYAKALEVFIRDFLMQDDEQQIFYSYWGSFHTVGFAKVKNHYPHIKTVCRLHRSDLYEYAASGNYIPFRPEDLNALNKIILIADEGLEYLKKTYSNPFQHAEVHRLGVADQPEKNPDPVQGFPHHIVSCSSLTEVKRVHLIIQALGQFQKKGIPFKWTHFGDGPLGDGLKEMAKKEFHNNNFDFRGQVSNSEIMGFYARNSIDVFVNASSSEGIPVSIMEAFSMGIPVIAPPVGGIGEILNHKENGFLIDVNASPADISSAIERVLKDENYIEMRVNAFHTWQQKYRADTNFSEFAVSLSKLLNTEP